MDRAITTLTTLPAIFEGLGKTAVETDLAPLDEVYLGTFQAWLRQAAPRAILEYHRGHLCHDRSPAAALSDDRRRALARVAKAALQAAERGQVFLVQRRNGPCDFSYLAIKAARKLTRRSARPEAAPMRRAA